MRADQKAPSGNSPRLRRPNPVGGCPLTAALAAIGGKWKLIIVYWLAESPRHFAALRQVMPGISQKVLTQQLRELVDDGIVRRQPTGEIPAPVEYSLTDYGRSVLPLVEGIRVWGRAHIEHLATAADPQLRDSPTDIFGGASFDCSKRKVSTGMTIERPSGRLRAGVRTDAVVPDSTSAGQPFDPTHR